MFSESVIIVARSYNVLTKDRLRVVGCSDVLFRCSDVPVDEAPGDREPGRGSLHALLHLEQHPGQVDHASVTSAR